MEHIDPTYTHKDVSDLGNLIVSAALDRVAVATSKQFEVTLELNTHPDADEATPWGWELDVLDSRPCKDPEHTTYVNVAWGYADSPLAAFTAAKEALPAVVTALLAKRPLPVPPTDPLYADC